MAETAMRTELSEALKWLIAACVGYAEEEGIPLPNEPSEFADRISWVNSVIRHAHKKSRSAGEDRIELLADTILGCARTVRDTLEHLAREGADIDAAAD